MAITYKQWEKDRKHRSRAANSVSFGQFLEDTQDKKDPLKLSTLRQLASTGFITLDYGTGSYHNVFDADERPIYTYHNVGLPMGGVVILLSRTSGGKTTWAVEAGAAVIEPWVTRSLYKETIDEMIQPKEKYEISKGEVFIQIADAEKTLDLDYVKKLLNYTNKDMEKHIIASPISTDKDVIKLLQKHAQFKYENMVPEYMPMLDLYGRPVKAYPPTVMIVDSTSQLVLEEVDDPTITKKGSIMDSYEQAARGSAGAQRARVISQLYTQMVNYAAKYNILVFSINHINKMPAMMGVPVKGQVFLRPGESVSGGEKPMYLASNILRMDFIKRIGNDSSTAVNFGDDITGSINKFSWLKSKSNGKRNTAQVVYTNLNGYDRVLSEIWNAKEMNQLAKKGNFYYLDAYPEFSFTMRAESIFEAFSSHPEMFSALYDQMAKNATPLLDNPTNAKQWEKKLMNKARQDIAEERSEGLLSKEEAFEMDDMFSMFND